MALRIIVEFAELASLICTWSKANNEHLKSDIKLVTTTSNRAGISRHLRHHSLVIQNIT